jgi:N-acetylneuraminate synthase
MNKTYIIAEAGVNHNGNDDLAFQLIDVAAEAGADAVKFQTFKAESIVTKDLQKAAYQTNVFDPPESQFEMLKKLELDYKTHYKLADYCKSIGIDFLSTAFDIESLDFIVKKLYVKTLKIPSGEITNGPLLLANALTGRNLIISTGMATHEEVVDALSVVAFGLSSNSKTILPSKRSFIDAYNSPRGQLLLKEKVTLLHATTQYPTLPVDVNLKSMITMRQDFGLKVGYSDHTEGILVPIMATTLGASIIEKHFTLNKEMRGPDHKASLSPDELKDMVKGIRSVTSIMGDGIKKPRISELQNIDIVRKSVVALTAIKKGDVFSDKNITIKRPGNGLSPLDYWEILGKKSKKNYEIDDLITN